MCNFLSNNYLIVKKHSYYFLDWGGLRGMGGMGERVSEERWGRRGVGEGVREKGWEMRDEVWGRRGWGGCDEGGGGEGGRVGRRSERLCVRGKAWRKWAIGSDLDLDPDLWKKFQIRIHGKMMRIFWIRILNHCMGWKEARSAFILSVTVTRVILYCLPCALHNFFVIKGCAVEILIKDFRTFYYPIFFKRGKTLEKNTFLNLIHLQYVSPHSRNFLYNSSWWQILN